MIARTVVAGPRWADELNRVGGARHRYGRPTTNLRRTAQASPREDPPRAPAALVRVPDLALARRAAPGLEDIGSSYGGWMMPTGLIEPAWTCYSVGAGGDVSFDLELRGASTRRCVRSRRFPTWWSWRPLEGAGESRFSAHHAAVAPHDGPIRMQVTHDSQQPLGLAGGPV